MLTVLICFLFPLGSTMVVVPYLESTFVTVSALALSANNMLIMVGMLALVVLLPLLFSSRSNKRIVPLYLSGENTGDDGADQRERGVTRRLADRRDGVALGRGGLEEVALVRRRVSGRNDGSR